jgi:hypothetical protein
MSVLRRTPAVQARLLQLDHMIRDAETRLALLRAHGEHLSETQAQADLVERLRAERERLRRGRGAA